MQEPQLVQMLNSLQNLECYLVHLFLNDNLSSFLSDSLLKRQIIRLYVKPSELLGLTSFKSHVVRLLFCQLNEPLLTIDFLQDSNLILKILIVRRVDNDHKFEVGIILVRVFAQDAMRFLIYHIDFIPLFEWWLILLHLL